jgi:5-formyltetrahydrofolate cyclo-ligase
LTAAQKEKAALRARVQADLNRMAPSERAAASAEACERLRGQDVWRNARSVLFYAPLPGELNLWPMLLEAIEDGKTAALPRFVADGNRYVACRVRDVATDLRSGRFGIREPVESCPELALDHLDLILAPGVAYDLEGRRLGRGKGFYDRLLAGFKGLSCGVAFDRQIVSRIPEEPHDVVLNCILTPTRWQLVAGTRPVPK